MSQLNTANTLNTLKAGSIVVIDNLEFEVKVNEQYFRKSKDADGNEVRRDTAHYFVPAVVGSNDNDVSDDQLAENLVSIISAYPKQVAAILNKSMDEQAKSQFVDNKDNWQFIPDIKEVSLKLIGDKLLEPVRRGRIVTKVTLESLGNWYKDYSVNVLGKSDKAATNGSNIIKDNFSGYTSELEVIKMFVEVFKDVDTDNREQIQADDVITLQALVNQLEEIVKANEQAKVSVAEL